VTYATERGKAGRKPLTILELDLNFCINTYGGKLLSPENGKCTAALSPGSECYNTRHSCQDPANYNGLIPKTYRFSQPLADLPKGIQMYPVIVGEPNLAPVGAPVYGVGDRGKVVITLQDFPHNDQGTDPYVANRSYTPISQGTFFGKFIARNKYYIGREMRVRTGFITDPFDWANFQDRTYIIDKIEGPDSNEKVRVYGSDLLRLTDDEITKIPLQSSGTYLAGLASSPLIIKISGDYTKYDTSGDVRIGDEIYGYTGQSIHSPEDGTFSLTGITRQTWGTELSTPGVGDTVQLCKSWTSVNVVDIVYELLNTYAGIDASKIPYNNGSPEDEWDIEKVNWLSNNNLTNIISEPEGLKGILEELTEQNQFSLFVDQVADNIKLITNTPPLTNTGIPSINDTSNFLKGSVSVIEDVKNQFTRVSVLYAPRNYTKSGETNYKLGRLDINANSESVELYNRTREKRIESRWFDDTNGSQVSQLSGRLKSRFTDPPKVVHFTLDAKDSDLWSGDLVDICTRKLQGHTGADTIIRVQILSVEEMKDRYKYVAMATQFVGIYAFIAPNGLNDYSAETDLNREQYAFICYNSGLFNDGQAAYKII
jgi:hypothetical protein